MSLLDNGPDEVSVYVEEAATDEYGNVLTVPGATPVLVRGRFQPAGNQGAWSGAEDATEGQDATGWARFICRTFPGGPWAHVAFAGDVYEVLGEPRIHRGSTLTAHVTVMLRLRGPEV